MGPYHVVTFKYVPLLLHTFKSGVREESVSVLEPQKKRLNVLLFF